MRLKFQVDYFDKATIFDTNPEAKTLDYIECCKESGWHHVFSVGKMQIFYSADENPIPIQTDENMKFKLASKSTILANWVIWILLPLVWEFAMISTVLPNLLNPKTYVQYSISVTSFMGFGFGVFCLGFTLFSIINMIRFGIFFGTFFGTIFLALLVNKITYRKWANRQINIALTIVISVAVPYVFIIGVVFSIISNHDAKVSSGNTTYYYSKDSIDIKLDDLGFDKPDNFLYEETIHERDKTFLGMREVYSDCCHKDNKSYGYSINIFSSKFSYIMDKYNKLILGDKNYALIGFTDTGNSWCSDKVFYGKGENTSMYVVMGEGRTFVITGDLNKVQAAELSSYYMKK